MIIKLWYLSSLMELISLVYLSTAHFTWICIDLYYFFFPVTRSSCPVRVETPVASSKCFRRHSPFGLLRASRFLHLRDGETLALQGPLRLHHRKGCFGGAVGQELLQTSGANGHGLSLIRSHSSGYQGWKSLGRSQDHAAQVDWLRFGILSQGWGLHRLWR